MVRVFRDFCVRDVSCLISCFFVIFVVNILVQREGPKTYDFLNFLNVRIFGCFNFSREIQTFDESQIFKYSNVLAPCPPQFFNFT